MELLKIKCAPKFNFSLSSTSKQVMDVVKMCFKTQDIIKFKPKIKKKTNETDKAFNVRKAKTKLITKLKIINIYDEVSEFEILIKRGLIDFISILVRTLSSEFPELKIEVDIPQLEPLTLSPIWEDRFKQHPKGEPYATWQREDFDTLTKSFTGIAELFTGYGKSELLISITDSLPVEQNILVLAPSYPILDELILRFEKYGIEVGLGDWSKRINLINPNGFMNSSKSMDSEAVKWLSLVRTCLSDECHSNSSASYTKLFELLDSLERSYGFSASPDKVSGEKLNVLDQVFFDVGSTILLMVNKVGTTKTHREHPINVHIHRVKYPIADIEFMKDPELHWSEKMDHSISHKNMAKVINRVINSFPGVKFYIPYTKIEPGLQLHRNLKKLGSQGIFWADKILDPEEYHTEKTPLESLKKLFLKDEIKYLISTSVGFQGIDLPNLGGYVPLTGKSNRMIVQPAGRSARGDDLIIVFIFDQNNPMLISQSLYRYNAVKDKYRIITNNAIVM